MKRRFPLLALSLSAFACVPEAPPDGHGHGLEVTVDGASLSKEWTEENGWLLSKPLVLEDPATRVAAMLTLSSPDAEDGALLEARGGSGAWLSLESVFREDALSVVYVDLPEAGETVQLRVRVEDADRLEVVTFAASNPEPAELVEEQRQGLVPELQNAGIIPRSAWGARPRRCSSRDSAKVRMAIHHSVTARSSGGRYEPVLRQIQSFHMDGRGYCDVAYHFLVTADGRVWEGRDVDTRGGHSYNYNSGNIGVVFVGCFDSSSTCNGLGGRTAPEAMMAGAARAIHALSNRHGIPIDGNRIKGHGQQPYQSTACPGDALRGRLEELRQRARNAGGPPAPPPPPPPANPPVQATASCGAVASHQLLTRGTQMTSCNGDYRLVHQGDGNVVLYNTRSGDPVWATGTNGRATANLVMQHDGNLVLYSSGGTALWASGTAGHHGARLAVQDDGNVVIYTAGNTAVWATNTVGAGAPPPPPPPPPGQASAQCGAVGSNQVLARGTGMSSCNGRYRLEHQGDGNLVLYNTQSGNAVWHTGTHGRATGNLIMQSDGNLVLYTPSGTPLWHTGTNGHAGASLAIQDDGNVVVYAPGARPVFATGTVGR